MSLMGHKRSVSASNRAEPCFTQLQGLPFQMDVQIVRAAIRENLAAPYTSASQQLSAAEHSFRQVNP
jgi:hypothetical protein